jgi:hypothetical protein
MTEIRHRLEAHRKDALVLLEETAKTARLYEGFRLAGAVCHIARAQVLLTEEIEGFSGSSAQEASSATGSVGSSAQNDDPTPVDGIRFLVEDPTS